jgi:hypothetical protein
MPLLALKKAHSLLKNPTPGALKFALNHLAAAKVGIEGLASRGSLTVGQKLLMGQEIQQLSPLALQAQRLYADLFRLSSNRDDAAANYTVEGRSGVVQEETRLVAHG